MDTDEFNRKLGEYGFGDQPEVDSAQPKQVLATVAALGQPGSEEATNQSDPQPSRQGSPMSRERPRRDSSSEELLSPEEMVARAVLNKPITSGDAADPEALEATRKEMLATAKKLADTAAALRDERAEAASLMDQFDRQDREIADTLKHVKSMAQEWEVKMTYAQAEADRIVREAIPPRRINFATPAEQQPLETPKDNMLKAAELLKKKDEEVDINYLRKLVASAMQQQSKADTRAVVPCRSSPDLALDLEKNSIFCWFDLKTAFEKHFRGTYKRPATASDLQACIQKKGETSRHYLTRWLACRNECENVDHTTAMYAFIGGLQRGGLLRHTLTRLANSNKLTLDEMISIASDHTAADDDAGGDLAATAIPLHQQKKNRDNGNSSSHKRKNPDDQKSGGSEMVAMEFQRGGSGGGRGRGRGGGAGRGQQHATEVTAGGSRAPQTYEEYRDMPCLAHLDPVTGKSTHTNRNCKWVNDLKNDPEAGYKRARKHRPRGKGGKGKNKDKEEDSSEAMDEDDNSPDPKVGSAGKSNPFEKKSVGAYHTFLGTPTVRATKSATRILNATVPAVPQYVRWSEVPCTFDREDHPAIVPKECYALVVSPRIDGYDFSKCLMDGGASLNIMYLETLERMNLTKEQLKHSNTEFHGVVPGKKANSLGSITLPVAFGDVHNFREEKITFEVVPFKSSYHVIFDRPTYHKFHARACYIYNKLKIPGPKGATYQRTMQRCLKDQIGRNVHAYVDDIAVMTRKGSD
ncbi:hypothetical protein QYE76_040225 [Lolium multiflorum]|uniref:Retrotransposon gag domain-containing protein n=1 Tax=Lolium multiflorum TaxID=4521 RepID=A0AAD8TCK0_LOLMU|nr:hypothetical protein QYE76_040225 [Lolium multiflorum]